MFDLNCLQAELEPGLQARFDFVAGQMSLLATSSPLLSPFQIDRRSAAPVCLLGRPPKPTPSASPAVAAAASPQDATKTRSPAPTPATATAEPAEAASPMHAFLDAVALALWGVREGGILEDAVRLSLRHLHLPFVSHTNHLRLKAPFLTARYPPPPAPPPDKHAAWQSAGVLPAKFRSTLPGRWKRSGRAYAPAPCRCRSRPWH